MKIESERSNFLKAWQIAEKYTVSQQRDALNGVRIIASTDSVMLEATDLKSSVKCTLRAAKVLEPGVAVLNAAFFGNMLRKATAETLTLEVNDSRGTLKADKSRSRFPVVPAETFPNIPESSGAELVCSIMASDLARVITEGSCAASAPSDFPKYMGTCMLKTADKYIIVVSTDGRRLARSKTLCMSMDKEEELVLPAAALKETAKNFTGEGTVRVLADGSTVWFMLEKRDIVKEEPESAPEGNDESEAPAENWIERVEVMEFALQRIETSFPKYEKILNNEVRTTLNVLKPVLLPAFERIDLVAKENASRIMAMILNPNPDPDKPHLRITARAPELGTTSEGLNAKVDGEYMQVGFNAGFFLDGLRAVSSDRITIEFSSDEGQTRILKEDSDDFLYMLMPIRLTPQDLVPEDDSGDFTPAGDTYEFSQDASEQNQDKDSQDEAPQYDYSDAPF